MKGTKKTLFRAFCVLLCFAVAVCTAPITRAAGLLRLIIDGNTYNRVYTDTGVLAITHWAYDASDDVLRLENFGTQESPQSKIFAYPYSGSMTVELIGDNYITVNRETAVSIIGNVTFTGTGSLTINCPDSYSIYTDYQLTVSQGASITINALAGITAEKGFVIDTTGSISITTMTKSLYTYRDINIRGGYISLTSNTNAIFSSTGNVYMSGGDTDVEITSGSAAISLMEPDAYVEWSANGIVSAGDTAPGSPISVYTDEKYFHASFSGIPKLNPPRNIHWDDTVIDNDGTTNPVGRWSAVANASGYVVNLYYYDNTIYTLQESFTVTDALSCNFGGHFTTYGRYFFTVQALGNGTDFITSNESPRSGTAYLFSGDIASRFYVTLPESEHFTIVPVSGSTVVYYGDPYSFTIDVDPAYTQSEILVWANGVRVALRHGLYTIDSVTENITITIGELSLNTYHVNLPEDEAFILRPLPGYSVDVAYGGNFKFSIELSDIYLQSNPVIWANGVQLIPQFGIIYSVSNITVDQEVVVTGLVRDNYDVTFKQLDGTVISTQTVDHGYNAAVPSDPPAPDNALTFAGWYNEDGTQYDFSTPIVEHRTVYARYECVKDSNDYYLISTLEQFKWFRDEVDFGNGDIDAKLTADISMNSGNYVMLGNEAVFSPEAEIWMPIGRYDYTSEDSYVRFYSGNFDGDGHTLSGFYTEYDAMDANATNLGIFGVVTEDGSIENLNVTQSEFKGYSNIGAIVGRCEGTVSGCTSSASCEGIESVGGIVGYAEKPITGCSFSGSVTVEQYTSSQTAAPIGGRYGGGIVGRLSAQTVAVSDCHNSGIIASYEYAGGIVGYFDGEALTFNGCTNTGAITSDSYAGGICSNGGDSFTLCKNSGNVSGVLYAGGMVASNDTAVYTSSSNSGSVSSQNYAGGIAGKGDVTASSFVFNSGNVSGGAKGGGITGEGNVQIESGFNSGSITADTLAGGFTAQGDVTLELCHSFGVVTAQTADAFSPSAAGSGLTDTYFCSERFPNEADGTGAPYDWFYSGYLAFILNRSRGSSVWAQGEYCPEFASPENPAFVNPFSVDSNMFNPNLITNERELRLLSALVNNESGYANGYYSLTADITLHNAQEENNFIPIGSAEKHFMGVLEGNSHTVSGVNISLSTDNVGLFSYIDNGIIEHLSLSNCSISGVENVGGIVGCSDFGYLYYNEIYSSTINGYSSVGGIVGQQTGDTYRCFNRSAVVGTVAVGGIVGFNEENAISYCYNYGNVSGVESGDIEPAEIGGITGKSFGTIIDCGNVGTVTLAGSYAGGIVGTNYGILDSLFNAGAVSADTDCGAICGANDSYSLPENCYYLEGCVSAGTNDIGVPQSALYCANGVSAYRLNYEGQSISWQQGELYPEIADENGEYAVLFAYTFFSFGTECYYAATYPGGSIVPPTAPEVSGYNFLRWDKPLTDIHETTDTHALYDRSAYITFIPTTSIGSVDYDEGSVVVGINPEDRMTAGELLSKITNEKIIISDADGVLELDSDDYIFTGATVQLYEEIGIYYHTAWVVIYGDVNSDGIVDAYDAFILGLIDSQMISVDDLTYPQRLAADVNNDGLINYADMEYLEIYALNGNEIDQFRDLYSDI